MVTIVGKEENAPLRGLTTRGAQIISDELAKPSREEAATGSRTRLAWGAVVAGALTALALLVLSNALAFACEIPAFRGQAYGVGSALWSIASAAVAFFIGGVVVEYLTRRGETRVGILHGALAWVLAVNLTVLLSMPTFGVFHGFLPLDAMRWASGAPGQPLEHSVSIAAWGVFLSLLVGLICAAVGGATGYSIFERRRAT